MSEAFYEPLGGGRFRSTAHTAGPWDVRSQHAGPPAALLGRALEGTDPREGTLLSRVTYEILGPACWLRTSHGPAVWAVERNRPPPSGS